MTGLLRTLGAWIVALGLGATFVRLDPSRTLAPDALFSAARAGLVALMGAWALTGGGAAGLRRWAPTLLDGPIGGPAAFALGLGLAGTALLPVAWIGVHWLFASVALFALAAIGWLRAGSVRMPALPSAAWLACVVLLLPGLADALAPPTDTDEVYYHLALARRIAEDHGLVGGLLHPDGSRPLPVHLVHASLLALGGEAAPRIFHLGAVLTLVIAVWGLAEHHFGQGRGWMPLLALLGSYSFLREAGLAYNDHLVALHVLLAAHCAIDRRARAAGVFAGFALAAKYTAAPVLLGVASVLLVDAARAAARGAAIRALAASLALALLSVAPWWLRNAVEGLHPLFPYAGWPDVADFTFVYPDKYGMGRSTADFVRLPWNLLFHARTDSFAFLGRLSPLWAVIAAGALLAAVRNGSRAVRVLLVAALVGFVGWAAGAQLLRWLLPVSGVAAVLGGVLRPRAPWLALWLAGSTANLGPLWARASDQAAVVTGVESHDDYLRRTLTAWPALAYLRDHVPDDARVAMLFSWHGYHVRQDVLLGSVEDHVPTRWWLARHGDGALDALRAEGVTHLLVGDVGFLKASYPFLTPQRLDAEFKAPKERLRALLLRDATRLFAEGRWEVWRLDARSPSTELDAPAGTR